MSTVALGPVSTYLRARLAVRLRERRVVVWYDGPGAFAGLLDILGLPDTTVVSAAGSALQARRRAEVVYRGLNEPQGTRCPRQRPIC